MTSKYNIRSESKILLILEIFIFLICLMTFLIAFIIIVALIFGINSSLFRSNVILSFLFGSCCISILAMIFLIAFFYFISFPLSLYDLIAPYKFEINLNTLVVKRPFKPKNKFPLKGLKCEYYYPVGRLIIIRKKSRKEYKFVVPDVIVFIEQNELTVKKDWLDPNVKGFLERTYQLTNRFNRRMDKRKME